MYYCHCFNKFWTLVADIKIIWTNRQSLAGTNFLLKIFSGKIRNGTCMFNVPPPSYFIRSRKRERKIRYLFLTPKIFTFLVNVSRTYVAANNVSRQHNLSENNAVFFAFCKSICCSGQLSRTRYFCIRYYTKRIQTRHRVQCFIKINNATERP